MRDIVIINTGGTFNKCYDQKSGNMVINKETEDLKSLTKKMFRKDIRIINIIQKDSLFFDDEDRQLLLETIKSQAKARTIVIHGTDTMNQSCEFVAQHIKDQTIVFTGAFVPYSIDETEAVANLSLAVGYGQAVEKFGTYIAMHGVVSPHKDIKKDKVNDTFIYL